MTLRDYAIVVAVVAAAGVLGFSLRPQPHPVGVHVEAPPAPPVAKVEREPVKVDQVQAYKPPAKKTLALPPAVQADPAQHVVAATRTTSDERAHTVTTVLDTATGEFTTYDRAEPDPWLAVNTKSEVGVFYGYKGGEPAIRIDARQTLLQVKQLRIGAVASADATPGQIDTFVGVGAWMRW